MFRPDGGVPLSGAEFPKISAVSDDNGIAFYNNDICLTGIQKHCRDIYCINADSKKTVQNVFSVIEEHLNLKVLTI